MDAIYLRISKNIWGETASLVASSDFRVKKYCSWGWDFRQRKMRVWNTRASRRHRRSKGSVGALIMAIEYKIAWGIYLGAGLILLSLWSWVSQIISSSILRNVSRATVFLLIFLPWNLPGEDGYYAPASLVILLEYSIGSAEKIGGALLALASSIGSVSVFCILREIFKR